MYSGYELIWLFFCTSFWAGYWRLYQQQHIAGRKLWIKKFDDVRLKKIYPNALKVE